MVFLLRKVPMADLTDIEDAKLIEVTIVRVK